jgi:hypothetical protein
MKKVMFTPFVLLLSALVFGFIGYIVGLGNALGCPRKHQNFINDGRIVIIPVDTIEGRKTYNVLFNDEDGMDSMYPEEIGFGLATGDWDYNEMLEIKQEN